MFEAIAATAPTANPGAPPSVYPAISTMSVVGLTLGSGANAIRPSVASAASEATTATVRDDGRERSYHQNPPASASARITNEASGQLTAATRSRFAPRPALRSPLQP